MQTSLKRNKRSAHDYTPFVRFPAMLTKLRITFKSAFLFWVCLIFVNLFFFLTPGMVWLNLYVKMIISRYYFVLYYLNLQRVTAAQVVGLFFAVAHLQTTFQWCDFTDVDCSLII